MLVDVSCALVGGALCALVFALVGGALCALVFVHRFGVRCVRSSLFWVALFFLFVS